MRRFLIRLAAVSAAGGALTAVFHFSIGQFLALAGLLLIMVTGFAALFPSEIHGPDASREDRTGATDYPPVWPRGRDHRDSGSDGGSGGDGGGD